MLKLGKFVKPKRDVVKTPAPSIAGDPVKSVPKPLQSIKASRGDSKASTQRKQDRGNSGDGNQEKAGRSTSTLTQFQSKDDTRQTKAPQQLTTRSETLQHSQTTNNEKQSLRRSSKTQRSPTNIIRRKSVTSAQSRRFTKKLYNLVTELRNSNRYYKHELKKAQDANLQDVIEFQKEIEVLTREPVKLHQELDKWKRRCHELEDRNVAFTKSKNLTKENQNLKEDLQVSKSVICRLNKELQLCQEKLGIHERNVADTIEKADTDSCMDFNDEPGDHPRKKLLPLLTAYDEVIREKNEVIRDYENVLKKFKSQCKEIVHENEDLYDFITDKQEKGTVSIEEWQVLHVNALVVLEENEILHEEIKLLTRKEEAMMKAHHAKVDKLKIKLSALGDEKKVLQEEIRKTEVRCKSLREQQSRLSEILEKRIPLEQHEASVSECKLLFEELKTNYNLERTVLVEKLEGSEKEKNRLIGEIVELEECNARLQVSIKTCEETLAANVVQFKDVYTAMLEATKSRDASTIAMEETMILSQRIVEDRANTEGLLQEQRIFNDNLLRFREQQSMLVTELHGKIREMEEVHAQEVEKYVIKIQDLERRMEQLCVDYQQRSGCLESVINEKSKHIDHLETEKRQLQLDLETVWKTTTSTMKEISNAR